MSVRLMLGGLKSYLPVPERTYKGTGGTSSSEYSYSIWFRHLSLVTEHLGGRKPGLGKVVELGPGDSIGSGLAAMLSGADTYIGLDAIEHASDEVNRRVLDELVALFRHRAPLAGDETWPRAYPRLQSYDFPAHLLDDAELTRRLSPEYLERLRSAMRTMSKPGNAMVQYLSSWRTDSVSSGSVDYLFSQGVLNDMDHTAARDDLTRNLDSMTQWLKPGGVMSHQIELACDGGQPWNHHWAYGPSAWTIIRGRRPYYKNRVPLSEYKRLFAAAGCPISAVVPVIRQGLPREATAAQFRNLPEEDFRTAAAFVIAKKPA